MFDGAQQWKVEAVLSSFHSMKIQFESNHSDLLFHFLRLDLASNSDKFDHFVKCFAELPMYFMTFHGEECIDKVIEVRRF